MDPSAPLPSHAPPRPLFPGAAAATPVTLAPPFP